MKFIKFIISVLVTILFFIAITVLPYSITVKNTILNKNYVVKGFSKAGVSDEICSIISGEEKKFLDNFEEEMKKQIKENIDYSDLNGVSINQYLETPEVKNTIDASKEALSTILNQFNSKKGVERIINSIIKIMYEEKEISYKTISKEIKILMNNLILDNNIKLTSEAEAELNEYIDTLAKELNDDIISDLGKEIKTNKLGNTIQNPIPIVIDAVKIACIVLIILIIVLFVIILLLNSTKIYSGLIKTSIHISISAAIIKVLNILASKIFLDEVGMEGEVSVIKFIENTISGMIKSLDHFFIAYLCVAVVLLVTAIIIKCMLKKKDKGAENII